MTTVVMFSGGAASWSAARRLVDQGVEDVVLLFTDTRTEDEDLYRFLYEAARDIDRPLVQLADGRDIWQVFKDERFLGNSRADPCSKILKRQMAHRWLEEHYPDTTTTTVALGLDWTEGHRITKATNAWLPYPVIAPMAMPPLQLKAEMLANLTARGIEPPRLYGMGFTHNNCGGGCVKAGRSHFVQLLQVFPTRYAEWEAGEESIRQHLDKNVSILTERSGDEATPLTLRDLREQVEAGVSQPLWDVGGCGCFEEPEDFSG